MWVERNHVVTMELPWATPRRYEQARFRDLRYKVRMRAYSGLRVEEVQRMVVRIGRTSWRRRAPGSVRWCSSVEDQ